MNILAKFHGNPSVLHTLYSFDDDTSHQNHSVSFHRQKKYKHVTPSPRNMSTMVSQCEPPANELIGPWKFTASKMVLHGKAIVFLVTFHPSYM